MRDYDPTPPLDNAGEPIEHFNSTILSHAYYEYVKRIGHPKAGRVLHNVPATLSPRPTFNEVARGFVARAGEIYPQTASSAVAAGSSRALSLLLEQRAYSNTRHRVPAWDEHQARRTRVL